ncbi:efflux RND transporter periplasmic adaptor subunit [Parachitinimonas caeni]|uniref:Efflux RND transporter periplasmic adaptor subunit n=1 Tax=Parachitinimonas caeni TaxID=3031301 RepID=A0ABT7E1Z5_9NEIS|nr:efflux RND transporter periplasmic adaptor subunit [Parachitinimonas caeni]MDK2124932.1 efflux RND transporter periplasmic adaptor subunit [Parachitinimonas caeni]
MNAPDSHPFPSSAIPASGAGMDRRLPSRPGLRWLKLGAAMLASGLAGGLLWLAMPQGVAINLTELEVAPVVQGQFRDELTVRATVQPLASVMLDATEGGRVEAVLVRDGALVKRGDLLFRLSNPQREQEVLARAADVAQQVANLAGLKVGLESSRAEHLRRLNDLGYALDRQRKAHQRNQQLATQGFLSAAALEESYDRLADQQHQLDQATLAMQAEITTRRQAIAQMERAIAGLSAGLKLVQTTAAGLAVQATADGRLTDFRLQLGESIKPGDRLGRIDSPDQFKLTANVDEFYLNRLQPGLKATVLLAGQSMVLTVSRLNPQIKDGRFSLELVFDQPPPAGGLKPGLGLDGRLTLGQAHSALLVPDNNFYADTGGTWIFVLSADGQRAERRAVKFGRRAAGQIEVLSGLMAGEKVIVSSYRHFQDAQRLRLTR